VLDVMSLFSFMGFDLPISC